jgi:hypothetical protein
MTQIRITLFGSALVILFFLFSGDPVKEAVRDDRSNGGTLLGGLLFLVCLVLPQLLLLGLSISSKVEVQTIVTGSAMGLGMAAVLVTGFVSILAWLDAQFGHRSPVANLALAISFAVHIWMIIAGKIESKALGPKQALNQWVALAPVLSGAWLYKVFQVFQAYLN